MSDPWADIRERLERGEVVYFVPEFKALLADSDALLAIVPFARHKSECQIARAWGNGPGGTFTDPHCNCGFLTALAAAPQHLRGDEDAQ